MAAWTLTQDSSGRTVVSWGRRTRTFPTEEAALSFIRETRSPTDSVVRVDKDGYRTPVTRRRWRNRASAM